MLVTTIVLFLFTPGFLAHAFYNPASGDDWARYKPKAPSLKGSFDSLPFNFGIVINPFELDDSGSYNTPELEPIVPKTTTVVKTQTVVTVALPTKTADVYQIQDGQVQRIPESKDDEDDEDDDCLEDQSFARRDVNSGSDDDADFEDDDFGSDEELIHAVSCVGSTTLQMTLENGVLKDLQDRIGSIVGSRQFQFDGPVPQYGTIYASGWLVTRRGQLSLGNSTLFYQCSSGDFYNLYDSPIGPQCSPVSLTVVKLIKC